MIYVYLLPVTLINGTTTIAGTAYIHDAIINPTANPSFHQVYMDPSDFEHSQLSALATEWHQASPEEEAYFADNLNHYTLSPDLIRAREILATSPTVITQPEIWELLRIFGRFLGITQT